MTIHISLDLETWGTTPGSDIRSIGACVFDPATGAVGAGFEPEKNFLPIPFYIATDNPIIYSYDRTLDGKRAYPLTRDPRTVQWWSEQSEEARAAFADPVDLRDALVRFGQWLRDISGPTPPEFALRIWSHGAAFDPPILAAAYAACGLPVPWHYRAPRDTRTAFDMAGVDDHSAFLNGFATGTVHHALDDAICQAKAVCEAYRTVSAWAVAHNAMTPPAPYRRPTQ